MKKLPFLFTALTVVFSTATTQADITNALIAHWAFDETSGTNAADSSGHGYKAALYNFQTNISQFVPGVIGNALFFNSDQNNHNDYALTVPITFPSNLTSTPNGTDQYSFSFWINRQSQTTGSYPRVISPYGAGTWYVLWGQRGGVGMSLNPLPPDSDPAVGQWIHYVVTADLDAQEYGVYSNTVPVLANVGCGQPPPGVNQWVIGHNENPGQPGDFWIGALDDVRIYNRILSANDVLELFDLAPTPTPMDPPVFLQQPQGTTNIAGQPLTMYATVFGSPFVSAYQWYVNGTNIPNATSYSLSMANPQLTNSGAYTLRAGNGVSNVFSKPAMVQMNPAPLLPDYTNGLTAWWKFDETNGLSAADSSANAYNLELVNFVGDDSQWVPGRVGGALQFNMDTGGVLEPSYADYAVTFKPITFTNQTEFTFAFWIKLESSQTPSGINPNPRIISPENVTHWVLYDPSANLGIGFYVPPSASPPILVGVWQHWALVFDQARSIYSVYLNGLPVAQDIPGNKPQPGAAHWIIGHSENPAAATDGFYGELDDLRVYNRLLSSLDIAGLYNSAPPVFPTIDSQSSPGAYYKVVGQNAAFSVQAQGGQLSYQWRIGTTNIANATNSTLDFSSLQLTNAGTYMAVVSNAAGVTNTQPIILEVEAVTATNLLTYGLIADWGFNETNGQVSADSWSTNDLTLINWAGDISPWPNSQWTNGVIGGALIFNEVPGGSVDPVHDDYAVTTDPIVLDNQDEFSFSFWINRSVTNAGSYPRVIAPYLDTPTDQPWCLWGQGAGVCIYPPIAGYDIGRDPAIGQWENYVVVYSRPTGFYSVFLDGVEVTTDAPGVIYDAPGTDYWMIGHNENAGQFGDYWVGALDEVRFYNRLLTAGDAMALARLGGGVLTTPLSARRDLVAGTEVTVVFSEPVGASTATNPANYSINHGGPIVSAVLANDDTVVLTTASWLTSSNTNVLTCSGLQDGAGNIIATTNLTVATPLDTVRLQSNLGGTNNLLVLEAVDYSQNLPSSDGSHEWVFTTAPINLIAGSSNTNFSAAGVMEAQPIAGVNEGVSTMGPELSYKVNFTSAGVYYVWVRGIGDSSPGPSMSDSVLFGLDGTLTGAIGNGSSFPQGAGFVWAGASNVIALSDAMVVANPGLHVINVWMREDGFDFDKLILTGNLNYVPANVGAAESGVGLLPLTVTGSSSSITVNWASGTLQSSTNVTGPYLNVPGAISPYVLVPSGSRKFYRATQ